MSKVLIVAEKPSVAKDIANALGGFTKVEDWFESGTAIVASAIGHLVEIYAPEADEGGKDLATLPVVPPVFQLRPIEKTEARYKQLKKLLLRSEVDCVVNACDAGREGELIFRLIYEHAGCKKPMKRMWMQSMTPASVRAAYESLRDGREFEPLGDAAKCRSEADWLVGINGSRGVTGMRLHQTGIFEMSPVGRVQTPTLTMPVLRELERAAFVPQDYWEIHGTFGAKAGDYVGRWTNPNVPKKRSGGDEDKSEGEQERTRFFDIKQAQAIVDKCRGVNPSSVKDESKPSISQPPQLFDLTTLQREANTKFKFSAKKTLDLAQALYETHKATSYPRTDSAYLPEDYVDSVGGVLATFVGSDYAPHAKRVIDNSWVRPNKRIFDNDKISDHFAIIPTEIRPSSLSADEQKIYDLIVRRFIAAFHPAAEYNVTTRTTIVADETFIANGKVLVKQGWLEVYGQASNATKGALCMVEEGEPVRTVSIDLKALKTKEPPRYTEATLLAAMEGAGKHVADELRDVMAGKGLGTPATRAATIEGLIARAYIVREGTDQFLVPTAKAMELIQFLMANGIEMLTSAQMTGEWEQKLAMVEKRQMSRPQFMTDAAKLSHDIINAIRSKVAAMPSGAGEPLAVPCPKCNSVVEVGRFEYTCSSCDFKVPRNMAQRPISREEAEQLMQKKALPELHGFISKAKKKFSAPLIINEQFEVKFDFAEDEPQGEPLPVPCPVCKTGAIYERGKLYACEKGDFKLLKEVSGKLLPPHIAAKLIKDKELPISDGFTSKTNTKFSAGLKLQKPEADGFAGVKFEFPPRR